MLYIGIAAGIFLLEMFLKNSVERRLSEGALLERCGGLLLLRNYHNKGAFLDIGRKARKLIAALSLFVTLVFTALFLLALGQKKTRLVKTGLALLLGGAYSNTYDRLRRKYVVDYFSFGVRWERLRRIVFNLSDFCIMIGAALAALAREENI